MNVIENLSNHNLLEIFNIVNYCFRWIFWQLVRLLAILVNGVEAAINKIYTLNGFFSSSEVINMLNKYRPVIWIILAFSIAFLGYKFIFNRKVNKGDLPGNFLLAVVVVVLLPTMMVKLGSMSNIIIKDSIISNNSTSANEIIKSNIYDLYYLDSNKFNLSNKNNIKSESILSIDALETIDLDEVKNDDILGKKIELDKNGNKKLVDLEKGFFKIDEAYYRYSIDFLTIIVTLGATGIALICFGLKLGRLFYELGVNQIFATIIAFADIQDGKKLKATINQICTTFIIIFSTTIILKLYFIFTTWVGTTLNGNDVATNFAKLLLLVGASIGVIDGPNIIERILGMDAGLKNAWSTMVGTYGAAKVAGGVGKAILNVGATIGKGALIGGSFTAGAISGMMGKSNHSDTSKSNSNMLLGEGIEDDINKKSNSNNKNSTENERDDLNSNMSIEEEMKNSNTNKSGISSSNGEDLNNNSVDNKDNNNYKESLNTSDKTVSTENNISDSNKGISRENEDFNKEILDSNTNNNINNNPNNTKIDSKDNRDKYIDMDNTPSIEEDIKNGSKGPGRKEGINNTPIDMGEERNSLRDNRSNITDRDIMNSSKGPGRKEGINNTPIDIGEERNSLRDNRSNITDRDIMNSSKGTGRKEGINNTPIDIGEGRSSLGANRSNITDSNIMNRSKGTGRKEGMNNTPIDMGEERNSLRDNRSNITDRDIMNRSKGTGRKEGINNTPIDMGEERNSLRDNRSNITDRDIMNSSKGTGRKEGINNTPIDIGEERNSLRDNRSNITDRDIMNSSKGTGRKEGINNTPIDIGEGRSSLGANRSNITDSNIMNGSKGTERKEEINGASTNISGMSKNKSDNNISNDNIINNSNRNNNSDSNSFNNSGVEKTTKSQERESNKEQINVKQDSKVHEEHSSKSDNLNRGSNKEYNLPGKMEDRNIGNFLKDKARANKLLDDINRSFNLGKNTTNDWDIGRNRKK